MKKRFLCAVLATLLTLSSVIASAATVTLYAYDGRTVSVDSSLVADYKKVGWHEGVTMYAEDGRSAVISPFKVADYKNVGWCEGVTMYATDGRTTLVSPFKVADYKKVGWYENKADTYALLYTVDGRVLYAPKGKIQTYTQIGWSTKPLALTITEKDANYSYGSGVLQVFGPETTDSSKYPKDKNAKVLYVYGSVNTIGSFAFYDYLYLFRVELSNSVTGIEWHAFNSDTVTRIGIPKSVTYISPSAFGSYAYADDIVIYCEKGSKAAEFAQKEKIKYVYATMIYSPDGRTMMVDAEEKEAYLASGLWADAPVITMYALDGKTKMVKKTDVAAYKKVGWYDKKSDVIATMYATDGRTKEVFKANVEKEKAAGWFKTKPVKMYTIDGRTKYVEATDVAAYKNVGWFKTKPVKMYSADGRTKYVEATDVEANKKVGWFKTTPVKMYATDGRTKYVESTDVEANRKVGWFTTKPVKMYAVDGRTKYVESTDVAANKKVGWYLEAMAMVYTTDGRTKVVKKTEVEAYKKVGWFKTKPVKMYTVDGRTKYVESTDVEANKKVGWFKTKPVKMYSADGRTKYVESTDVAANKKVGWFKTKPVKMYSADGRTKYVESTDVTANKKAGWFKTKPVKMYSADGRTKYVESTDVTANKKAGWYDKKSDAYQLLYSADGRIMYAPKAKVSQYTSAGWSTKYTEFAPTVKLGRALYGAGILQVFGPNALEDDLYKANTNIKTLYIGGNVSGIGPSEFNSCSNLSRVEISDTVTYIGYYNFYNTNITRIGIPKSVNSLSDVFDVYYSTPKNLVIYCEKGSAAERFAKIYNIKYVYATMIYCVDGRTMMVTAEEKEAYLASGLWYTTPKIKMYSADGKTKIVDRKNVAAYKKVGWYEKVDYLTTMYATNGKTKLVALKDVAANKKVGWFDAPPVTVYSIDGKTKVISSNDVAAYKKVGWYDNKADVTTTMYSADGRTKQVFKGKVAAEKKVGWLSLADYGKLLVNKYGGETALATIESQENTVDSATYNNAVKETLNAYYRKVGCPLAVVDWSRGSDYGIPEIHITFRNLSQKTIVAFENNFTCYDAYGNITTDFPSLYNGSYNGYCDDEYVLSGTKFTRTWTLYNNERTHSISWPSIIKIAFSDGSTWYK